MLNVVDEFFLFFLASILTMMYSMMLMLAIDVLFILIESFFQSPFLLRWVMISSTCQLGTNAREEPKYSNKFQISCFLTPHEAFQHPTPRSFSKRYEDFSTPTKLFETRHKYSN